MNDATHAQQVADEAALEAHYSSSLIEAERRQRVLHKRLITPNTFTASLPLDPAAGGELVGRVRLGRSHGLVGGEDFYIGTAYYEDSRCTVYPWTAPIAARTFYRRTGGERTTAALDALCEDAVGVRAFVHRRDKIEDLQDEWLDGRDATVPMFSRTRLSVPRPPTRPPAPPAAPEVTPDGVAGDLPPVTQGPGEGVALPPRISADRPHAEAGAQTPVAPKSRTETRKVPGPPLRTAELLRRQLAAPKQSSMSTVLATLQPDQYEVITALATADQVLQGHPGTGKTIIAVHRAAYLLSEHELDDPDDARARGRVLIIGPTDEYVSHVSAALRKLISDAERFTAVSLPSLLEDLAGLPRTSTPTETNSYLDVDLGLSALVDSAFAKVMREAGGFPDAVSVYEALIGFLKEPPGGVLDPEWVEYLRGLPSTYAELKRARRRAHRSFMAYLGLRTMDTPPQYGHIIVDEAQDIHPLEWDVLARIPNAGGWTILGDLNQRRTDHTFSSWDKVAERLAIDTDGRAPVQILERGYRSTAQIIQFANQLLPRGERVLYSLQREGAAPKILKVAATDLYPAALGEALELDAQVASGTTAIIAADFGAMRATMPRSGWQADSGDLTIWRKEGRTLRVLPAERARGLEFDAVVVVEPSAFPELYGRKGVLYTALTRANKLVTVMHSRPMPEQLRGR